MARMYTVIYSSHIPEKKDGFEKKKKKTLGWRHPFLSTSEKIGSSWREHPPTEWRRSKTKWS
jgi:hypothetical protein